MFDKKLVITHDAFTPVNFSRLMEIIKELVETNSSHIQHDRMLMKYYKSQGNADVKVMDDNNIKAGNKATRALYQIIPFVGKKDFYTYDRVADKEGNITEVKRILQKEAPFGVYQIWRRAKELGYNDMIVERSILWGITTAITTTTMRLLEKLKPKKKKNKKKEKSSPPEKILEI